MLTEGRVRRINCYWSSQKILLVGEGDFSFSACLARAFRTATNIVATSYFDEDTLVYKHWTCVPHLEQLERLGGLLLYEVDVYEMHIHPVLKKMKFDVIIFNFPHAGHFDYLCERDTELIEFGESLLYASKMLNEGGEVHIRHRDDEPYSTWNVVLLAAEAGLKLKEKVPFKKTQFPGYHNKRGGDIDTNKTFPIGFSCTSKFVLDLPKVINESHDDSKKGEICDHDNCDLPKKDEESVDQEINHDLDVVQKEHTKNDDDDDLLKKDATFDNHDDVSKIDEGDQKSDLWRDQRSWACCWII
ncbi:hypothetical protein OSB04_015656 [Centaurea solstitialis]|uniref:25S rRNA (uridine-N(3))-methyltransferase BMT5-like domain-containing protein n=1 Tax=Centaurea solstitialis TaxID=347529 RepID=A0AA38TCT0_9ASTR|nr:hypothetical protein OSB04_015656 [Centaurea solstitialis]